MTAVYYFGLLFTFSFFKDDLLKLALGAKARYQLLGFHASGALGENSLRSRKGRFESHRSVNYQCGNGSIQSTSHPKFNHYGYFAKALALVLYQPGCTLVLIFRRMVRAFGGNSLGRTKRSSNSCNR